MSNISEAELARIREGFRRIALARMAHGFARGEYDDAIILLCDDPTVDHLTIMFQIKLVANDIIVMRGIAGCPEDEAIDKRIRELWEAGA